MHFSLSPSLSPHPPSPPLPPCVLLSLFLVPRYAPPSSPQGIHIMDPTLPDGLYPFRGSTLLQRTGTRVTLAGTDTLACSAVDLATCVRNLRDFAGVSLSEAIVCATENPATVLGLMGNSGRSSSSGGDGGGEERIQMGKKGEGRKGRIDVGFEADLLRLGPEGNVKETWIRGVRVWKRNNS